MKSKSPQPSRLVVISGVNGEIGGAYYDYFSKLPKTSVLGLGRSKRSLSGYIRTDLLDKESAIKAAKSIPFKGADEIIYLHVIGKFRFEDENHPIIDEDNDGLDDEVFNTNYTSFENFVEPLLKFSMSGRRGKQDLKVALCDISSISDKYRVPFWNSYSTAKAKLRERIWEIIEEPRNEDRIRGIVTSVSSVGGKQLKGERRFFKANEHLLTPKEIVRKSVPYILDQSLHFAEINIYRPKKNFSHKVFTDHGIVKKRWYEDMYGKGKRI